MNPAKLKERQIAISATPLGNRASAFSGGRRILPKNNIALEDPIDKAYSNFFDYEEELSGLKPSSELFNQITYLEEKSDANSYTSNNNNTSKSFVLEEIEDPTPIILEEVDHTVQKTFDFVQCEFIKQNGERCKRQSPKSSKICSKHKNLTLI
jgi:hypothetical protein